MKDWFENLQPRERTIVMVGGIAVLLILLWALIWNPITSRTAELRTDVQNDRELLSWMEDASHRIKAVENSGTRPIKTNITLIAAVENTSKRSGLRTAISSMQPDGNDKINLDIKDANFDDMIRWQGQLLSEYGIRAEQFSAKPSDKPGLVNARLTLTR